MWRLKLHSWICDRCKVPALLYRTKNSQPRGALKTFYWWMPYKWNSARFDLISEHTSSLYFYNCISYALECNLTCGVHRTYTNICDRLTCSGISSPFVWPLRSWWIWGNAAQDKGSGCRLQKGVDWATAGVKANWKLGPKPGTACHAPGSIQLRFKEPWNLSRATQTNYSNKQQVTPPRSHPPHLPGGKQTAQDPVAPATEPWPARPATDRLFPTLFVSLFTQKHQRLRQRGGLSSQSSGPKGVGRKKRNANYMWFSPSWGIMGLVYLIGTDKLDCEWALMTARPTGTLGVLF